MVEGAVDGGVVCNGAVPVVVPGCVLGRGVRSRMPAGGCGEVRPLCAVWPGGGFAASCLLVLFNP